VYVVLKGAHTAVTTPDGNCYFNTTGNPGMATGGSGDVLTGILAGIMAQGYSPLETCLLGVYLHGLAGDLAAEETGQEALVAGDIVQHLGNAFLTLYGEF
jgi:NAD(P)H-hydrate repair Nnr-like enzyme with NAD(P)H-hydrate dehydratase domain